MIDTEEFIVIRRMLRLSNLLINIHEDYLTDYNLTYVQAEALLYFDLFEGRRAQDLKEYLNVSHQAARGIVERLNKKGYLYIKTSNEDARAKLIYLSDSGREICKELKKQGIDDGYKLFENIDNDDRKFFMDILNQMLENLK